MIVVRLKNVPETMQQIAYDAPKSTAQAYNLHGGAKTKAAMAWRVAMAARKWGQRPGEGDKAFVQV
jgi:hypothetical protein